MSAKLLYTLTDEKADLHKQIGCMNGFLQIFDRHQFLTGRRVKGHKVLPPPIPGQRGYHGVLNSVSEKSTGRSVKKVTNEKQRVSTESPRTSFTSSSCSSSFSSLECNRIAQLEPSSYGPNNFSKNTCRDFPMNQSKLQPLDLQEFVKNSVHREARALSVKTVTKEEAQGHIFKHVDSPRPLQQPKSVKQRDSGLSQSYQAPWNSKEEKDRSRLLPTRDGRLFTRDAPRFSFDGRESRDTFESLKIKELPRLSLDSRARTMRATAREMKSNSFVQYLQMEDRNSSKIVCQQKEMRSYNRPSSVVAKLMGLEAFPGDAEIIKNQTSLIKICPEREDESFYRSLDDSKQNHKLGSPRNSYRDSISPRVRNADSVTKSTSSSKFPIEPTPRKQAEGRRGSQVPGLKHQEADTKSSNSSASVYGEIEKRLADIEFKKSGKDLRALKRILEAMQKSKEMPETRKDHQASNLACQTGSNSNIEHSSELSDQRNLQNSSSAITKGNSSPRSSRSAIVIMKPATITDRANSTAILMTSTDSTSDDQKFQTFTYSRKGSVSRGNPSSCSPQSIDLNTRTRSPRSLQISKVATHVTGEKAISSGKSSGTVSPRLQQKKNGLEKQSFTTTPPSDSSGTRRQLSRQPIELGSPGRKLKPKSLNLQQSNNQLKKSSSSMKELRNHCDAISQQSESSTSSASHIELETDTTSTNGSNKNIPFFQHCGQKQKNLEVKFMAVRASAEPAVVTLEQPSPNSVLNATLYRNESPFPGKKISILFEGDEAVNSDKAERTVVGNNHQPQARTPNLSSESDHNESENIGHLASILALDESIINYTTVPCEPSNPDHRYISKILLASGLLRDLSSGMTTIPFHSSGHPINPETFLAVEQTMANIGLSEDDDSSKNTRNKITVEKTQRKLMFDVVNEILRHKLVSESCSKQWFSPNKQEGGKVKSQHLMTELFLEIDQLQTNKIGCLSQDEDDSLASISWEDMMHQSANWDHTSENAGLVLDIERLIFKDLISEVVRGRPASLKTCSGGYCRQLFSK